MQTKYYLSISLKYFTNEKIHFELFYNLQQILRAEKYSDSIFCTIEFSFVDFNSFCNKCQIKHQPADKREGMILT